MLTIKNGSNVVSNYKGAGSEDGETGSLGCGRNCLGKCCLPVSKLPLYAFKSDENESVENSTAVSSDKGSNVSFLNNLLLGHWEDRMRRGLFHYDVTACETKVIRGNYSFIAQLNEGRHLKKRPTEFCIDQVLQPFDKRRFNFTKVSQEEVLFRFEPSNDNMTHFFPSFPVGADSNSLSVVAINVSPIEYGHVLLLPHVLDCLPQRIDRDSLFLALHLVKEAADPFFRLGYNSLGAFATINHLHFQAYYLSVHFPVEKAPTRKIMTRKGLNDKVVAVLQLLNYPVRGLVFEHGNMMHDLCDAVSSSCIFLQNNNIPFNVLMADCGKRIFLFPQCYAEKQAVGEVNQELLDTQVNPAVWEISGHMVLKRRKDYDNASEEYAWRLLAEVSVSEEKLEELKTFILKVANLQEVEEEGCHKHSSHLPPQESLVLQPSINFPGNVLQH